jgi:hypothetical protein
MRFQLSAGLNRENVYNYKRNQPHLRRGSNSLNSTSVDIISSEPLFQEWHAQITMVAVYFKKI